MSKYSKPSKRLSSTQLLVMLAVLVILAVIEFWPKRLAPETLVQPTITAVQVSRTKAPLASTDLPTPEFSPQLPSQAPATQVSPVEAPPGESMREFDYFVLALSWSPDYCATSGGDDPQQCSIGRKLGFVLHGLWPQYNRGYPSNCSTEKLTADVKNQFPGLYPSHALYDHEWEKHGTCTGLSTTAYLTLSKQIKESVKIPDAYRAPEAPFRTTVDGLKKQFTQFNPGFPTSAFAVNCSGSGRYLKELQVCFSREGQPTACGSDVQKSAQKSCQSPDFLVRNIR